MSRSASVRRHPVEQTDRVGCVDFQHGGVVDRVVEAHAHLGVGAERTTPVRARPLGDTGFDRQATGHRLLDVVDHLGPVDGHRAAQVRAGKGRGDRELLECKSLRSGRRGVQHVEPAKHQRAGHAGEEAGPVGGDHGERRSLRRGPSSRRRAAATSVRRMGTRVHIGPRCPLATATRPVRPVFAPGRPSTPSTRWAGRACIGLGERDQQCEHLDGSDGIDHEVDGPGVTQVAPGRDLRQQQVMKHQRGQDLDVLVVETHARRESPRQLVADRRSGRHHVPFPGRAGAPPAPADPVGPPDRSGSRRSRPPPGGGGPR